MKFLTHYINGMFWFVVPIVIGIDAAIVLFALGDRTAALFVSQGGMYLAFAYALFLMGLGFATGDHERSRRLMSSDPIVERIVRRKMR